MLFTSVAFYFYFLPLFLGLFYFCSGGRSLNWLAKLVLIAGTYFFYGFENTAYLIPFLFATGMDLTWSLLLQRFQSPRARKLIMTASVLQNLSLFFIFKYLNGVAGFFPNCQALQTLHAAFSDNSGMIPLPPGISFYLFESLSFVIDCYRRTIRTPKNPVNFLVFITMFPRFIAGPIVRYSDLSDTIHDYKGMRVGDGIFLFILGFTVKILFADSFGSLVDAIFGSPGFYPAWISAISYTLQLYLDFSAYSLMAIGLGLALGFPFLDNFREPYSAKNMTEFWRRWHISLSTWLRDYLYIPLGGSQTGAVRTYVNLFLTMLIGGIWHGANLTFVIWGAYHGLLLVIERRLAASGKLYSSRALAFLLALIGWVVFRATTLPQALTVYHSMTGVDGWHGGTVKDYLKHHMIFVLFMLLGGVWALVVEPRVRDYRGGRAWNTLSLSRVPWPVIGLVTCAFVFALCLNLSARAVPFLYFQF